MFHVEKMKISDIPFAVQLANTMNWSMTPADFEFNMKLEPTGCFMLFHGQERSGLATCISFGKVGWFGNLIVTEDHRRKGAGKLLLKHAIDYLHSTGVETIGLYAYPHLVKFYESFGFESDIDFLVLKGKAQFSSVQNTLKMAKRADIPEITAFDSRLFGANRQKLLEAIVLEGENLCYVSTENRKVTGYIASKVYGETAEIGPLMCRSNREEEAVMLLEAMLNRLSDYEIFVYVPKKEAVLLKLLSEAGVKEDFRLVRMFLGSAVVQNCVCTAESLERG